MIDKLELKKREERKTLSWFGLDIMITPENQVKVIEVNGINAGAKGYKNLTGKDLFSMMLHDIHKKSDLPIFRFCPMDWIDYPEFVQPFTLFGEERNSVRITSLGQEGLDYVLPVLEGEGDHKQIMINHGTDSFLFDEAYFLVMNAYGVEKVTTNKKIGHLLFKGYEELRPSTVVLMDDYTEQDVKEFLNSSKASYFFIKPFTGLQGRNVIVASKKDLLTVSPREYYNARELSGFEEKNLLIEEGIVSKSLLSFETFQNYAGCMRYLVLASSNGGEISLDHYGAYWRLAPHPLSSKDLEKKLVANHARGSLPEFVEDDDLLLVKTEINRFFPTYYRRMLRMPLNELPDEGMTLTDYCY